MSIVYQDGLLSIGLHYGIETTHKIAKSFLVQSASTVRVNTSRTDVETISKELLQEGYHVDIDQLIPYCLPYR